MTTSFAPQAVTARHLLSLTEIGPDSLAWLVNRGLEIAKHGVSVPPLIGKTIGIYFMQVLPFPYLDLMGTVMRLALQAVE